MKTTQARAQTASSKARNTAIKQTTEKKNRRPQPPQSAVWKARDERQAQKVANLELEQEKDQALFQAQILSYYRSRADAFDTDRAQLYQKLDQIRIKQDVVHKNEWELRKRRQEKMELETALERCQHVLNVERQKIMDIKRQCDTFRVKQRSNKREILDMLAKSNSVEQHIYYNDKQQPEKISHFAPQSMGLLAEKEAMSDIWRGKQVDMEGNGVPRATVGSSRGATGTQPNILRTVYLPNEKVGQIQSHNDRLNGEIQQQRADHERILMQLRDQKALFEEEQREKYMRYQQRVEELRGQIQETEVFNQQVVKDHVDALSAHELEERKQQEELEQIRQENMAMREQIRTTTLSTQKTKTKAKQDYVNETMGFQEKFREQARFAQENISIIRDQYRKVSEIYKRKTGEMRERLTTETVKVDRNEQRRRLELEGYSADLQNMKRKIEFYQKYIIKLKALVEEDRGVVDLFTNLRREQSEMDDLRDVNDQDYRVENIESRQINIEAGGNMDQQ